MKPFLAVLSTGLLLALAACASDVPAAEPAPSASATVGATPEPSPDPVPPTAAQLALAPGSLSLLVIGQPAPATDDPTAMIVFDPEACVDPDFGVAPGDPGAGLWRAAPAYYGPDGGALFGVAVAESGEVQVIQVVRPSTVPTTKGIVVGSTVAELLAAYPTITGPIDASVSRLYVVDEGAGRLVFEVSWNDPAFDPYWQPDELDRVVVMTTHATSLSPLAVWATDGGIGYCGI